jgi:positive regulator of sigma E activity
MEILAYNSIKAGMGQKVKFIMIQENMIRISFMLFILPLLSIFFFFYAGSIAASYIHFNETAFMTIGAFLFLAAAIVIIYFYDKRYKRNKSNFPQVIEVIK